MDVTLRSTHRRTREVAHEDVGHGQPGGPGEGAGAAGRAPSLLGGGPTRRGALGWLGGAVLPALAACAAPVGEAPPRPELLTGGFELISQNWPPLNAIHEQAINGFQQKHPQTKLTLTNVAYGEIATKVSASLAAGAGPDGFFHYSGFWRGVDASAVMRPLTPQLFRRNELERLTYANLLGSVPARNGEVYFLPAFVGMGGAGILYNTSLLSGANIDPASFTTLDAVLAGAAKLVVREGATIKRAGLLHAHTQSLIFRWILDQGGRFYDERAFKWQFQTVEAERAMQWLLDLYDKHGVTWRKAPDGVRDALGEGHAAMSVTGPFALSGYVKSFPDVKLEDRPLPGFVPGKAPHYFEPELAGYSLSALLKPDEPRTRIGVAFLRHLLAPDNAMLLANEYSGAILVRGVYEDPRFKDTTFGAARARLPEQIISKIVLIPTGANPYDFGVQINKVVAGELSIRAALAEAQQLFTTQEEEARRNRG